jgi:hypothetical protein
MGIKAGLIKPFAKHAAKTIQKWSAQPLEAQEQVFNSLLKVLKQTEFGKDHDLHKVNSYEAFKEKVKINDYEYLRPYIDRIIAGEENVLWKGRPKYFAKTSGTTSGVKYIPLTKESIPNHFGTARNAMFNFAAKANKFDFFDGNMIFLSGSPELTQTGGIHTGRLSGIVNHMVPSWLRASQLPSYPTNCIDEWEDKLEAIVNETLNKDMRLISGIPPWVQMYYERLLERTGKKHIKDIFPNYSVFAYGGVNFEPYRLILEELVGQRLKSVETYPASEGFIAFQDNVENDGLLLNVNSGIFFEFIPLDEISKPNPTRISLKDVQIGVNYAIILNTNAGLWGYNIGDTVEFVSTSPYRLRVTGRIKHFISAFGEHVIGKEVEEAMLFASKKHGARITEFTVAPNIKPADGSTAHHQWLIEFEQNPDNMDAFSKSLDAEMCRQNIYYKDLIDGSVLSPLKVKELGKDAFRTYMKSQGKLGGQNKVPRLSNDRKIADLLK